ncbi:MAG: GNAT family N-acetyltransferase [Pseudomonadota bacterium]
MTAPAFGLRTASHADFPFARRLYLSSMQPLLTALDAWNADEIDCAFRGYFIPDEVRFVTIDDEDVGWFQVSKTDAALWLDQLHLVEDVRGQGIGTALIHKVIADATAQGKDVNLSLIKGNPAHALYRRLGFRRTSEDETKLHMRYETDTTG